MKVKLIGKLTQGSEYAAGYDLTASCDVFIHPYKRKLIPTDIRIQMPNNMVAMVFPRSGLANNYGIVAATGTIDSDFRGQLHVNLFNHSDVGFEVKKGMRIAQLVFLPVIRPEFEEVELLDETVRGENGFGSSGLL